MDLEIDVSGEDILRKDYTIVVAERNGSSKDPIIYGYKLKGDALRILKSKYGQGKYRYGLSHSQKSLFKIRLYSIVIYYLISHIQNKTGISSINLYICRDFDGRENDIRSNLKYFLIDLLKLDIKSMLFYRLEKGSNADKYAFLMRKDKNNLMKSNYLNIRPEELEIFLKK